MGMPNTIGAITFDVANSVFNRADSNIPYTIWDATLEGWHSALGSGLPAPGYINVPSPLVTSTGNAMHIAYDVLGMTYWMLTRQEEVGRTDLDEHGRFPATSSHAHKHGYLERPVVDEWLYFLGQVIKCVWPDIVLKKHTFNIKLSHDVDHPSRYAFRGLSGLSKAIIGDILRHRNLSSFTVAPQVWMSTRKSLHPDDPFNTFDWIMNESELHGLQSTFYFICGNTHKYDADYKLEHPAIRSLLLSIHNRGHEIGLHPSYGTYQRPDLIYKEALNLRQICLEEGIKQDEWSSRMHYLRWDQPKTLLACASAGLSRDSTLTYADFAGFRCGTCFEFPAFDPVSKEAIHIRVQPLIAMEGTIINEKYMGLGLGDKAYKKLLYLKENCRLVGGTFSLLWHNSRLITKSEKELYRNIL
jgi:hypothetical protein